MTSDPAPTPTHPVQAIVDAIPEGGDAPKDGPNVWKSSIGVTFILRVVSQHILMDGSRAFPVPAVPMVHITTDDRWEENPADPAYIKAVNDWRAKQAELSYAIMLTRGAMPVLTHLPSGVDSPGSTDWSDDLEFTNLQVPLSGRGRLYAWMKYVALPTEQDFWGLYQAVAELSGMTKEVDVARAVETFRST